MCLKWLSSAATVTRGCYFDTRTREPKILLLNFDSLSRRSLLLWREFKGWKMWVFTYGSLMFEGWERAGGYAVRTKAELQGYSRVFNKASLRNWGTRQFPCPTLNLIRSPL